MAVAFIEGFDVGARNTAREADEAHIGIDQGCWHRSIPSPYTHNDQSGEHLVFHPGMESEYRSCTSDKHCKTQWKGRE